MMEQGYPFDPTARKGSRKAAFLAADTMKEAAGSIRNKCFNVIAAAGETGATGFDVCNALGLHVTQVRSRISELFAAKRVADSGRMRVGECDRPGTVWVLPEYGPPPADDGQDDLPGLAA